MKSLALLPVLLLVGATACGAGQAAPGTPSNASGSSDESLGATNAQASDNPQRALTKEECGELGDYITGICHETHTRQSRIEGWCSDIVSQVTAGSWADKCTSSVKYMDSVCFRSTDNAVAMMACDRTTAE